LFSPAGVGARLVGNVVSAAGRFLPARREVVGEEKRCFGVAQHRRGRNEGRFPHYSAAAGEGGAPLVTETVGKTQHESWCSESDATGG